MAHKTQAERDAEDAAVKAIVKGILNRFATVTSLDDFFGIVRDAAAAALKEMEANESAPE